MRKYLKKLMFKVSGGHVILYAKPTAMFGEKLLVIERDQYELVLAEIQYRWLRGFLLGMALIAVFTVASFLAGVRAAWYEEKVQFAKHCGRVVRQVCDGDPKSMMDIEVKYPVADWSLVPPKNFKPQGVKP